MKDNFYIRLKDYKTKNKVSNAVLGQVIGKNEPAMRQAIKRESLSKFEINELEKLFDYKTETTENPLNTRIEVLETTVKSLKDNLKMVYDQLLFLQNSWIAEKNQKNNKRDLG